MLFKNKRVYPMIINHNGTNIVLHPGQVIDLPEWFKEAYSNVLEPLIINAPIVVGVDEPEILDENIEDDDIDSGIEEIEIKDVKRGRGRPKKG